MIKNIDKNVIKGICNSNEFKGFLLSRRWFGDKSALSNLEFGVSLQYFEIIDERIFLIIIGIKLKVTEISVLHNVSLML